MIRAFVLIGLLLGGLVVPLAGPAAAADLKPLHQKSWRYSVQRDALPFPRGERAQSVWASGACWSECGSYCAWGQTGCLERDTQGQCLKLTDKCDRYCQRECRTAGGPLLPIEFFWE
ncbi:MAG: hypothetical protein HY543_11515 [Deltaproteobacteria bacterium]|nr:hypothetical protein [Deltaproteobacteria bacterium]